MLGRISSFDLVLFWAKAISFYTGLGAVLVPYLPIYDLCTITRYHVSVLRPATFSAAASNTSYEECSMIHRSGICTTSIYIERQEEKTRL